MDSKTSVLLVFAVFLISTTTTATAFNITRLLERYPDFSSFNGLLTATQLYKQINARKTITVLAISNSHIGALTSKPEDFIKRILSIHVILDYYDGEKLSDLSKKSTILTTLYQSTGVADNQQGFLNITKSGGQVVFATASHKGVNATNATLVGVVAAQPYNISVVEVSGPIIPAGMDVMNVSDPVTLPPVQAPAPKAAKPPRRAPAPDVEVVDAPVDSPADSPADAPEADVPVSSPPAPAADEADAPAPAKSSTSRVAYSIGLAVAMGALSSLFA